MATKTKYVAPTTNFWSTTLNGAINDSVQTITLNSTTNLQAPGYLIIDREDGSGTATPNSREEIYFTGVSGNDITGVTRGADGSTARSHSDGAEVESQMTVGTWNSLVTVMDQLMTDDGLLKTLISPASIDVLHVGTHLAAGTASVTGLGLGLNPVFRFIGNLSGPTTFLQDPLVMPQDGDFSWVNVYTRTVASTASVIVDINKNGTSIFDSGTRPAIAAGGTLVSTASIKTQAFSEGDRITWDCDIVANEDTHITDLTVQLRAE